MYYTMMAFVILILGMGAYSLLFLRTDGWRKWTTPGIFAALSAIALVLLTYSLGMPRPSWLALDKYTVISVAYDEPHYIYIWAVPDGANEPVNIRLPWIEEQAKSIRKMQNNEETVIYDGWVPEDYEKMLYPEPIPAMPSKEIQ